MAQAAQVFHAGLRYAPGYVRAAAHPGHGEPVIYTPGQLLPDWVLAELAAGAPLIPEDEGVWRLGPRPAAPKAAKS